MKNRGFIFFAGVFILLLSIFQNCGQSFSSAGQNVLGSNAPDKSIQISKPFFLAGQTRTPLGRQYDSGKILVQAGPEVFTFSDSRFVPVSKPSGSYSQGSYHVTHVMDDGAFWAIDMRTNKIGQYITFDGAKWVGKFLEYASLQAPLAKESKFTIDKLPGNSNGLFEPFSFFSSETHLYISLYQTVLTDEVWTIDGEVKTIASHTFESWLVRADKKSPYDFKLVSRIADKNNYLAANPNTQDYELPFYYANGPRCISLPEHRIVCAMRSSADDDDGYRPLNLERTFFPPVIAQSADEKLFLGKYLVSSVYSKPPDLNLYYKPRDDLKIPPLLMAVSDDDGKTWKHSIIAEAGGVDAVMSYDPNKKILVIAYGGVTYPRKGQVLQWSRDLGTTWSSPKMMSDETDGYTSGTPFIFNSSPGNFTVVYDSLKRYHEFDCTNECSAVTKDYRVLYRNIEFP